MASENLGYDGRSRDVLHGNGNVFCLHAAVISNLYVYSGPSRNAPKRARVAKAAQIESDRAKGRLLNAFRDYVLSFGDGGLAGVRFDGLAGEPRGGMSGRDSEDPHIGRGNTDRAKSPISHVRLSLCLPANLPVAGCASNPPPAVRLRMPSMDFRK